MLVSFRRTGERRYAVIVDSAEFGVKWLDPAPGYDDDVPHDLVHYLVEAELGLLRGVFGRAAAGGGTFMTRGEPGMSARQRARQRRKQQTRDESLERRDAAAGAELEESERLAALVDLAVRRRLGQRPDLLRSAPEPTSSADLPRIERVALRLFELVPRWRALEIGEELTFEWPGVAPRTRRSAYELR